MSVNDPLFDEGQHPEVARYQRFLSCSRQGFDVPLHLAGRAIAEPVERKDHLDRQAPLRPPSAPARAVLGQSTRQVVGHARVERIVGAR